MPAPKRRGRPPSLKQLPEPTRIDKSVLAFPEPRRVRNKEHLKFVSSHPCLICGRQPSDAHHIRYAKLRALGRKVSDEFTVPVCRTHHREIHRHGNQAIWCDRQRLDPLKAAADLWQQTRTGNMDAQEADSPFDLTAAVATSPTVENGSRLYVDDETKPIVP